MGEARIKAATPMISVLIPERGRPEMLERLIQSLITNSGGDQRFEVLISIDDDDPEWKDKPPHEPYSATRPVLWFMGPRPPTLGTKLNLLAQQARGDILWFVSNDMQMVSYHWPAKFRQAVSKLPNGIGVPFVKDSFHPDHAAYPILTRKWLDTLGFLFPPCYPFWFVDTHVDCLGLMIGQHFEIDVEVESQGGRGKTHGLIDLPFWVDFYHKLEPYRLQEAMQLIIAAYGDGTPAAHQAAGALGQRQEYARQRTAHLSSSEFLAAWSDNAASPPGPGYALAKTSAEMMVRDLEKRRPKRERVAIACPSGRVWEATTGNCIAAMAAHSAIAGIDLCMLNVQSSDISHGRNTTVHLAREAGCSAVCWIDADMKFPADLLCRLLAWDKPVVGALYCKRVADKHGKYPMLGKLVGPKPDVMDDGLYEALLMPGGLMFVRMDVYDTLGFPPYAFVYRWPGDDGLEAFKTMMRQYFTGEPPDDALAELNDTKLGEWMRSGYRVGEDGESSLTFSEDLFFSRRCRKAGIKMFADIKLTGECAHLGEHSVTCLLGPEIVRLQEAAD